MFQIGDRVKRVKGGCEGVINLCKKEIWGSEQEKIDNTMYRVKWDSGTESYFAKEGLELVMCKADWDEWLSCYTSGLTNSIQ